MAANYRIATSEAAQNSCSTRVDDSCRELKTTVTISAIIKRDQKKTAIDNWGNNMPTFRVAIEIDIALWGMIACAALKFCY